MKRDDIEQTTLTEQPLNRRRFLTLWAMAATELMSPPAFAKRHAVPERSLAFYHMHTGEQLRTVYWARGRYLSASIAEINKILRDYYTGEVKPIDRGLLDLLYSVRNRTGTRQPFHIVSGYRSPATNAMLRQLDGHVAQHSLHVEGKAVDIRLPDRNLAMLRRAALSLHRGGVGYYPESDFVHVDVGRVRSW